MPYSVRIFGTQRHSQCDSGQKGGTWLQFSSHHVSTASPSKGYTAWHCRRVAAAVGDRDSLGLGGAALVVAFAALCVSNAYLVRYRHFLVFRILVNIFRNSCTEHTPNRKFFLNWNLHVFGEDSECGEGEESSQDELVHLVLSTL